MFGAGRSLSGVAALRRVRPVPVRGGLSARVGICFDRSRCGRYALTLCLGCALAPVRVFNRMTSCK